MTYWCCAVFSQAFCLLLISDAARHDLLFPVIKIVNAIRFQRKAAKYVVVAEP